MWNRAELKAKGKEAFKGNYWPCVGAAVLMNLLTAGSTATYRNNVNNATGGTEGLSETIEAMDPEVLVAVFGLIMGAIFIAWVVSTLLKIFVFNPLQVGCYRFFQKNVENTPAPIATIKEGFGNYVHVFLTLFVKDLFLLLWTCLFFIPGIVKAYSYRMVPFILKDNPDLSVTETITRSRQMMNGHKWAAFVLDLSFIGWHILTCITFGLVGIFWTNPYVANTNAALYLELRDKA